MSHKHSSKHIALIGCGRWGKNILRDLKSLGCVVSAVDTNEARRAEALELGAAAAACNFESIKDIDGAIVATTTSTHFSVVTELLMRFPNLPLFVEKPLCTSSSEARILAERGKGRVFVMDKWRYHPGILQIADFARTRRFGALRGLQSTRTDCFTPHRDVDPVNILLSHELSIALEVMGALPAPVSARGIWEGENLLHIHAHLGNGPWFICEVGARAVSKSRSVRAYFERAVVELNDAYATDLVCALHPSGWNNPNPEIIHHALANEMPLLSEIKAFLKFIDSPSDTPKSSVEEGSQIVECIALLRGMA